MTEFTGRAPLNLSDEDDISLIGLGTILLRNRWRIARWALAFAIIAALFALPRPALYRASASFVPQGNDRNRSGLASLAGQFGVAIPTANQSESPEFYSRLLQSRVILEPIVNDTVAVPELGGRRVSLIELFEIEAPSAKERQEKGVQILRRIVASSVNKTTGSVEVAASTRWPSVSMAIVTAAVDGVNRFNQRTRQGQAAEERKFVEGRLAVARDDLRQAEDRFERFLLANRQFASSPQLTFDHDRLQREVSVKQQVFTTLTEAYEDVRIREVRDTPVITILEPPFVPSVPEARGRVRTVILGFLIGAFLGALLSFSTEMVARRRRQGSADAQEFVGMLQEMRSNTFGRVRRLGSRGDR